MGCPDDGVLARFLDGTLPDDDGAAIEEHLDQCTTCRQTVSATARSGESHRIGPGTKIGRYELLSPLGAGAMGVVYVAFDPDLDRKIAVKLLAVGDQLGAPQLARRELRLAREARSLARISHPNVVPVHDVGVTAGRLFIAMELVEGDTLRGHVAVNPLSVRQCIELIVQAGRGLAAAHAAGVVHRDFKPDNVFVGRDGRVRVGDFGVATADPDDDRAAAGDVHLTRTGALLGTPVYMAPEQLRGEPATAASDQFALCVTAWEILFGKRPFSGDTPSELADAIQQPPPDPADGDPRVAAILRRGLHPDPTARHPDVIAMIEELDRTTRPARESLVFARHAARRRARWPWAVAAFATLVAISVGTLAWHGQRGRDAPSAAQGTSTIAVQDLELRFVSYGAAQPGGGEFGDVISILLTELAGHRRISPGQLHAEGGARPAWEAIARRLHASHLLRGSISQVGDTIEARLELVGLATGRTVPITARVRTLGELPTLMLDLAERVAQQLRPGTRLDRAPDRARALALYQVGMRALQRRDWMGARPYLEQAAAMDPSFDEAWHAVASVRGWTMAPQPLVEEAVGRALALAPPGAKQQIWQGAMHYFRGDYAQAIALLAPLETSTDVAAEDRRDLLYYLAEAAWHDGDHARGVALFRRILDRDVDFKQAAIHPGEYALARRDAATASLMLGVQGQTRSAVDFAEGKYEVVAASDDFPRNLHAQLVLDRPPAPELVGRLATHEAETFRVARALEAGDLGTARRELQARWARVTATPLTEGSIYELEALGEVLLGAQLGDELPELLALHARGPGARALRQGHRFSILAAPMLGVPTTFDRASMTGRNARLATAIEAELAGDRARAAALLGDLVADPAGTWDYPERVALARNLHALGRTRELAALCADIARPAVFRDALLPARRTCRQLLGQGAPSARLRTLR